MKTILLLFITLVINFSYSQENQFVLEESKLNLFVYEAYRDCPEYRTESYMERYLVWLNQVVIHQVDLGEYPQCRLLSTVSSKNKCNPNLNYSLDNFSPQNFNPFKYRFNFQNEVSTYYRVDNTNYIIEIKPKR